VFAGYTRGNCYAAARGWSLATIAGAGGAGGAGGAVTRHAISSRFGQGRIRSSEHSGGSSGDVGTGTPGWPDFALFARTWLSIFAGSLALFVIRFLVPSPVEMADNGDGSKLMCGLDVAAVTGGHARFVSYAYFTFDTGSWCGSFRGYPTSQHLLVVLARWLTPLLGLPGTVSLIALGLITCALQSAGIASLACGLRLPLTNTLLVAAALWLVVASEPHTAEARGCAANGSVRAEVQRGGARLGVASSLRRF
jgi:hypothetical protein